MANQITLFSSDGVTFEVDKKVADLSLPIKNMVEDVGQGNVVPIPNVDSNTLRKVIIYCQYYTDKYTTATEEERNTWNAEFLEVEQGELFQLILAANYLDIKSLLDLTCKAVADMIKGKTPDEIRKTFDIKNDFTPEEEEEIRRENAWCEDA